MTEPTAKDRLDAAAALERALDSCVSEPGRLRTHQMRHVAQALADRDEKARREEREACATLLESIRGLFSSQAELKATCVRLIRSRGPAPERPTLDGAVTLDRGNGAERVDVCTLPKPPVDHALFTTDVARCPSHESPDKRCPWCHMRWLSEQLKPAPVDPESRHPCIECGNDYAEGYCPHTRSEREHGHPKPAPVDPVREAARRVVENALRNRSRGYTTQVSLKRIGELAAALEADHG